MNNTYVIYRRCAVFPGLESSPYTYEVYDSVEGFMSMVEGFFEYVKFVSDSNDEDFEDEINEEIESDEVYREEIQLLANKAKDNDLHNETINSFNEEIEIILLTKNYHKFIDALYENYCEDYGEDPEIISDDLDEVFTDCPIMEHLIPFKKSGEYPNEVEFQKMFNELQDTMRTDDSFSITDYT